MGSTGGPSGNPMLLREAQMGPREGQVEPDAAQASPTGGQLEAKWNPTGAKNRF